MSEQHLRWIPTHAELRQVPHGPAVRDFYNHVYYRISDAPRAESQRAAERVRGLHEAGAQLFWCVVNRGVVRVHTYLDEQGQRILGQCETKSENPLPEVDMEWGFADTSQVRYSGHIREVRFRRQRTVGLVVLYPYRRVL